MFVQQVYQSVQEKTGNVFGKLTIDEVRMGIFLAVVKLSNGEMGVASVIDNHEVHQISKKNRDFGAFTPLQIAGKRVEELFAHPKNTALIQMLKIASLNAYFHELIHKNQYKILKNTDPVDTLNFSKFQSIVMVGAFNSYIQKITGTQANLQVLELNEEAFLPEHRSFFVPANRYSELIPKADLVIITGLTLVNNTFDALLHCIAPSSTSILIGPSASIPPELFFKNNISMIGGTMITEPEKLFDLASQGGAGYHLFEYCAEKITIVNEKNA